MSEDWKPLPCLVCGGELRSVLPESFKPSPPIQPLGAACYHSGHYGSNFDPFDGTYLHFNLCDDCLEKAARQGRVQHVTPGFRPPPGPSLVKLYDPDDWDANH